MTSVISPEMQVYFEAVLFMVGGYHIAFLFKNYSRFLAQQGFIIFVLILAWMFAVISVVTINVEVQANWIYTLSYSAAFCLRFLRDDL